MFYDQDVLTQHDQFGKGLLTILLFKFKEAQAQPLSRARASGSKDL